jgi:hypothetical protein
VRSRPEPAAGVALWLFTVSDVTDDQDVGF